MKADMRRALAQEPFEQKIRKVGELIRLAAVMKTQRVQEGSDSEGNVIFPRPKTDRQRSFDSKL